MTELQSSKRKLRILFIARDKFPPFRPDVTDLFGEELVGRGHCIDWILQSEEQLDASNKTTLYGGKAWVGATDLRVTRLGRLRNHIFGISNDLRMYGLSRKSAYDFIQVRDKLIAALFAIMVSKLNKTKFVYWLSFPIPEAKKYRAKTGLSRFPLFDRLRGSVFSFLLYRVIMPKADHIFVQSEQMKKDVAAKGVSVEKMTAVPMGVSLGKIRFPYNNEESEFDNEEKSVLYLGDLGKVRGMDFLLRVHKNVLEKIPDAKLYMVGGAGNPDDIIDLKNISQRLGIADSIIFTGFLKMEEAWSIVRRASVCVSPLYPTPIYKPASPTKLVEYMANGKAVVVNDHPEQRKVIQESGGGLCVPYEESAFATAIIEMLKNPDKAKQMGIKGREYVERCRSYRILADLVEKQYFKTCGYSTRLGEDSYD